MHFRFCIRLAVATIASFVFLSGSAWAALIEAEGVAAISSGGIKLARQSAIKDALRQASMQAGLSFEAADLVTPVGVMVTSSRMRAERDLTQPAILREWTEGDFFHVIVQVDNAQPGSARIPAPTYKKKIVATPFNVRKSLQLEDIDEISSSFPRELSHRLENSKKFLTKVSKFAFPAEAGAINPGIEAIRQISALQDSQFVISGEILDAGSGAEGGYWGLFETRKRRFEVEIFIHDGFTGALIARHRLNTFATGEHQIGRDKPFGSSAFFATNFGKAIDAVLNSTVEMIKIELEALPFAARIIRIEGEKAYLNAGATSALLPGDTLAVYRLKDQLPVIGLNGASEYGIPEMPVATLTINQVQPMFSIGEISLPMKDVKIREGDFARFESVK